MGTEPSRLVGVRGGCLPAEMMAIASLLAFSWPGLSNPNGNGIDTPAVKREQASARKEVVPPKVMMGDSSAGNRGQSAHILALRDPEGDSIQPDDRLPLPFSTRQTCGANCHDVQLIRRGWHFNATLPGVAAGRNGQPWVLVDRETATQVPLSYRAWPGTYKPQQLGMSTRDFALHFAGRMAGGLSGDDAGDRVERARWMVSGNLDVNCLACHDASPAYDPAEYARQVAMENFRYAPAAASGMALVTGSAREMPDLFDYLLPSSVEDNLQNKIPRVSYARNRFLPGEKVAFDIVREVKVSRCYYCHSNTDVEQTGASRWKASEDAHLARGITCVQCHRNGLDHMMIRGYEGELGAARDSFAASFSCRGCHMGRDADPNFTPGRLGAPYPRHAGIPPVHFEKLTCTACHSGPWPATNTRQIKNSLTHGLGEHNVNKAPEALPHIYYPVFAQQQDGKIAPNRLVWPAFWGRFWHGCVQPLKLEEVRRALKKGKLNRQLSADGSWPSIDEQWVGQVLRLLGQKSDTQGPAVYIAGGKLHRLDRAGRLESEDNEQAQPYLWPIAHDVRPASQALGARSCQDCHSTEAAIFFGNVAVDSPLVSERAASWKMNSFEKKLDIVYTTRLAQSWVYRSWLKAAGLIAAGVLLLFVFGYAVMALDRLSAGTVGRSSEAKEAAISPIRGSDS